MRIGLAGLGYWGPNLLRNFRTVPGCRLVAVADVDRPRLERAGALHPDVELLDSADELVSHRALDAVVLALPANILPQIAISALEHGKHVLVEKPMAPTLASALSMVEASSQSDRTAMVDFTFVYSPAVQYLRELIRTGRLGDPYYYQSTRINLGRFRSDVDVVWDLVVHDVSILAYLIDSPVLTVTAVGQMKNGRGVDTAQVTISYENGLKAFIQASWLAPVKVRTALVALDRGMVIYDDVHPDEKIRLYEVESDFDPQGENPIVPTFRLGNVLIPRLESEETLRSVALEFIDAIRSQRKARTDWMFARDVIGVLEAARLSLKDSRPVTLSEVAQTSRQVAGGRPGL